MDNHRFKKLGNNTILLSIGIFSSRILLFILVPVLTYSLSTEEFGIADLVTTTIQMLAPLLSLVASEALIRFALDLDKDKKQLFTISTIITTIGFLILLLVSPFIYEYFPFKDYYSFFLVYYIVYTFSFNVQQFTKGLEHVRGYVVSSIINAALVLGLSIVLLRFLHWGICGYLVSLISGPLISLIYLVITEKLWRYLITPQSIDMYFFRAYLVFCLPLIPNSISWWISNSSDKYILQFFYGASVTGIYAVSYKIPSMIAVMSAIFTGAWQISAVEDFGSRQSICFISDVYDKYCSFYYIVSSFIVLMVQPLALILFSKEFYDAWQYSVILTNAAVFQSLAGFLGVLYTTAKKTKMIFITTMIGAISNIAMNFVLIPMFGAFGAAVATLLSYSIVWIIRLVDSRRIIEYGVRSRHCLICFILLFAQMITTCLRTPGYIIVSIIVVLLEIGFNRSFVKDMADIVLIKLNRRA